MSFRLVPKSLTLNDLERKMAFILRYFTELGNDPYFDYFTVFVYVVKQMLDLPLFQNLLLIVYDHINTVCAIIKRLFRQNKLITRFDGRRCIDNYVHTLPLTN